jgi:hypothetical protein
MVELSQAAAAAEIVALINSRVSSPRQEELEAIIAKVGGGAAVPADLDRLAHWDGVVRQYLAFHDAAAAPAGESLEDNTKRYDRVGDALCAETEAVWAKPVRDWGDVILRAAVAVHWNSPANVGDPPYPQNVLRFAVNDDPHDGYDVHAVAHVIRGILDLARLSFDADGRLLSTPKPSALTAQQRQTWRRLIAEHEAAHAVSGVLHGDDPREPTAMAASAAADDRLAAFHEKIWASGCSDVRFLAEICFRCCWPGCDLTEARSDDLLQQGPHCMGDASERALAALLKAIRDGGATGGVAQSQSPLHMNQDRAAQSVQPTSMCS